jgi:protein-S-isoprenylcysteine O-methyltransferase Ste14
VAILTGAGVLTTRAQLDLGRSWRIGVDESERTELMTEGSFGVVRNPIFSGMGLAVVGAGLAVPTPASWLAAVALLTGVELQVRAVEEPYLLRTHGVAYREYGRRTGRFAPGIGRLR